MSSILDVRNLKISFRTSNGAVKAVRDISFQLEKGKTMAIVGESGSGKSVTSKAILGILAGNSIIEGGEIIYDGKDLLKIPEEEMYKIRGDKIAMIFQDPLSSLNPIMRIGKQITEAMLLKNKASRKESRRDFNKMLALLQTNMTAADPANAAAIKEMADTFNKFCIQANKLENGYNTDYSDAVELSAAVKDILFRVEKKLNPDYAQARRETLKKLKAIDNPYFIGNKGEELAGYVQKLQSCADMEQTAAVLVQLDAMLDGMLAAEKPDFFRIGFYTLQNPGEDLSKIPVAELNEKTLAYLDANFMNTFIAAQMKGVSYSFYQSLERKKMVMTALREAKAYFAGDYTKADATRYIKTLCDKVEASIDRLEIVKDSFAYTLRSGLTSSVEQYFNAIRNNPKEEARFARQTKKQEALLARGKNADYKVLPKSVYDLEELKAATVHLVERLEARYAEAIEAAQQVDMQEKCIAIVDYLKDKASKVVYKLSRTMAKEKAIKLMEEVGIPEARRRFKQYPFEFSGGMRQRIVIAIALSADPDVLICDEPTTALDVTIQAQILELINNLKRERNLSVIFITHDLGVVAIMADDIAVMYAGKIVEYGTADDVFYDPRHPYTWALLSAMPDLDTKDKLDSIPGTPPNMIYPPVGDAFAARNKYAMEIDFEMQPPLFEISETHKAATWLLHPEAPKVEVPKAITDRIARMKKAGGAQNG